MRRRKPLNGITVIQYRDPRRSVTIARRFLAITVWLLTISLAIWLVSWFVVGGVQYAGKSGAIRMGLEGCSFVYYFWYPPQLFGPGEEGWHCFHGHNYWKVLWGSRSDPTNYSALIYRMPCWEVSAAFAAVSIGLAAWLIVLAPSRRKRRALGGL